jgi:hypothetical protein
MKILVIISSYRFSENYIKNIYTLYAYLQTLPDTIIDYVGISSQNDFHTYENIIKFKYKIINQRKQFSKICDFITEYQTELQYDWFIKFRPEIFLFENLPFHQLSKNSINARARVYTGPKRIKYGCSVGGRGMFSHINDNKYDSYEHDIELDDQLYIFHRNVIDMGGFNLIHDIEHDTNLQHEFFHNNFWISKGIHQNVIGINMILMKNYTWSGDINI